MGWFSYVVVLRRNVLGRWISSDFSSVVALNNNVQHYLVLFEKLFSKNASAL
jgi:hypothetical protein